LMVLRWCFLSSLMMLPSSAVIVDRIAIVANDCVIKDSDIERDLRITDFLNGDKFDLGEPARKKAAQRLVDQQLIRHEVQVGGYSKATPEEADSFLKSIVKQRFEDNDSAYQGALKEYGITAAQLHDQLVWQITALHFIEQRFRPAVLVSEEDVDKYLLAHAAQFKDQNPKDAREAAQAKLTEERVNDAFEEWLEGAHKRATIEYHEAGLQ
jgi:hypothetical protein